MDTLDIKEGVRYSGTRWKATRQVTSIKRHRGQDAVVHYLDMRTHRTGNAPLASFAASASREVTLPPNHLTHPFKVEGWDYSRSPSPLIGRVMFKTEIEALAYASGSGDDGRDLPVLKSRLGDVEFA